jgi:trk system potassium uptake protein TrkH
MRWRFTLYVVGLLTFFFGLTMMVPLLTSVYFRDTTVIPLLVAMAVTLMAGGVLFGIFRRYKTDQINQREGMGIVTLSWMSVSFFGALPFVLAPEGLGFTDAVFESVSGFTTTGASVLTNIEAFPKSLLLWRGFIQWLGGMGIIVLSIAILPLVGVGGMQLYKAEVPTPVPDKLKPRIRETAVILWQVYLLFTAMEVVLLMVAGMSFFDAVCHAFTTLPTGGFSTRNASIAHFQSVPVDVIIIVFMLLAGINFSLHYQLLRGRPLIFWKDAECRFFFCIVAVLVLLVSIDTFGDVYDSIFDALRYSAFQVVSIVTTTGYATADYVKWPAMSQLVIFFCMFLGACAGSTGGGMKCLRIMLCIKYGYKELFGLIHPHAVSHIKIDGKPVPREVIHSILGFLALYIGLFVLAAIFLGALGVDFTTALGATASAIGNVGPGFGQVGPVENYAQIPAMGKWLLAWCMLLGRLEVYTVIILLVPEFWRP